MTAFSDRLRRMRQAAGLSQKDLAGDGLSPGYISLLELGRRTPSSEVVQQLAAKLGCSSTQLWSGEPSERDQRIELELAYARLAIEHGESAEARARLERLLAEDGIPARARDELGLLLGMAFERTGDLAAAVRVFRELMTRALDQETHLPVTVVGIGLLRCYLDSGDLHQAATTGELALRAAEAQHLGGTDDYYRLAATTMAAYMGLGDFLAARLWAEQYLTQAEREGRPAGQAAMYWNAAELAEHEGRLSDAIGLCERALGLMGESGTVRDSLRLQLDMAWLLLLDNPPQATRASGLLEHAAPGLNDLGSRVDRARWNWLLAKSYLLLGDLDRAEPRALEAVQLVAGAGPRERAQAHLVLSDLLRARGHAPDEVADPLLIAFACLAQIERSRAASLIWRELADRLVAAGRVGEALEAFGQALDGAGIRRRGTVVRSMPDERPQTRRGENADRSRSGPRAT